jgi:Macrocin-O-methyltransferase (TylF)
MSEIRVLSGATAAETGRRETLAEMIRHSPIPATELSTNLGLYLSRMQISRIMLMHQLYQMIVPVHGVIMEFGVRWGQNLALFSNFRGMYEPYNHNRKIIGFDTFAGFPSVDAKAVGDYAVAENYQEYLSTILEQHQADSPIPHKKKFELVAGDATRTIHEYLARQPETVVAMAYFDFDIYQPTKVCLEAILPRLTRGSVIAFDELNCPEFPGETLAVLETIGLGKYGLRRDPQNPLVSWMLID